MPSSLPQRRELGRAAWSGTLLTAKTDFRAGGVHVIPPFIPTTVSNRSATWLPELEAVCDTTVKIPMRGRADSLEPRRVATGG